MAKPKKAHAKHPPLLILKQKLQTEGYGSEFVSGEEGDGFDTLLIPLDEFEEGKDSEAQYVLQAFFVEDMMRAEVEELPEDELPNFAMLQLMAEMPFSWENVAKERFAEGMALLNVCSQKIPFGQFNLDGETIVYTYSYPSEDQKLNVSLITSMLDMMSFFINRMAPVFEQFSLSDMDLEQAFDALEEHILKEESAE